MLFQLQEQYIPAATAKRLSLTVCEADATVCFDPKWTSEAIGNLLDNAIKYTSTGGITVSVYTYELFARIDITDTGIGIDEEEFPKIFQRFYRSGQVQDESGVGIGLYLSREILSGENGYIKVSSVPGKGSVFSVYLPLS